MKPHRPKIVLMLIGISFCIHAFGVEPDNGLWNVLRVRKDFNEKLRSEVRFEHRNDEDFSATKNYFLELSSLYRVNKFVNFNLGYRYIISNDQTHFDNHHRLMLDAILKHKIHQSKLDMRLRYQGEVTQLSNLDPVNYFRSRLRLKQYIPSLKVEPYTMAESFLFLDTNINPLQRMRYTLGTYIYPKVNDYYLELFYHLEKGLALPNTSITNIYGVSIYFNI